MTVFRCDLSEWQALRAFATRIGVRHPGSLRQTGTFGGNVPAMYRLPKVTTSISLVGSELLEETIREDRPHRFVHCT